MSKIKVGDKVRLLFTTKEMHSQNCYRGVYTKGDEAVVSSVSWGTVGGDCLILLEGDSHHCSNLLSSQVERVKDIPKRRPHYDIIIAWANGAEVEICSSGSWYTISTPNFDRCCKYRVKEDPKQSEIKSIREEMDKLASRLKELE